MSHAAVWPCKFLPGGVDCGHKFSDCEHCGWNPKENKRRANILREMEKTQTPQLTLKGTKGGDLG